MADTKITVQGGKYTFRVNEMTGAVSIDRFGEQWITDGMIDIGSKALISLIHHALDLEQQVRLGRWSDDAR